MFKKTPYTHNDWKEIYQKCNNSSVYMSFSYFLNIHKLFYLLQYSVISPNVLRP